MTDINLLPIEEKTAERFALLRKRLMVVSVGLLAITAVFTLGTLGMFTSMVSKRSEFVDRVQKSSATISSLKPVEELIVVVKGKIAVAEKILGSRTSLADFFNQLSQLLPQGVYFTDLRMSSGKVVISGKARSSAEMASFVSSLSSEKGAQIISGVTIDSLSSDESGAYSFVISASLTGR